ncbi:MAG: serine protease [Rickettsiales bacterium]|nr:serine protease [Rickettsiales bacterium]
MRSILLSLCACLLLALPAQARPMPASFADLVEKLSPAVVNISTTQKVSSSPLQFQFKGLPDSPELDPFRQFFDQFSDKLGKGLPRQEREVTSLGSGFIISAEGYVVTNHHVINEADQIQVILSDDTKYDAKILGSDPKTDLALLKIDAGKKLPFVEFGDSDEMRVGDWVIAIGNPFGLGGSVSAGIISASSRVINAGPFDDFIQTDAAINRGNSGGPLFNTDGEVIGINSAIFSPSGGNVGIGFAIPSSLAEPILQQLKEFGRTHRGWLGVKIQHVSEEIAESVGLRKPRGALVLDVTEDSPAQRAGIESGDVIVRFDGKPVNEMRTLPRLVAGTQVGKRVEISVWRQGREVELDVTLGELEEEGVASEQAPVERADKKLADVQTQTIQGMELAELNDDLRSKYDIAGKVKGLLVVDVDVDSEAGKRGVRVRDVIVEVNQRAIDEMEEFRDALSRAARADRKFALLRIMRGDESRFVTLPTKE